MQTLNLNRQSIEGNLFSGRVVGSVVDSVSPPPFPPRVAFPPFVGAILFFDDNVTTMTTTMVDGISTRSSSKGFRQESTSVRGAWLDR